MKVYENASLVVLRDSLKTMSLSPSTSQDAMLNLLEETSDGDIDIIDINNAALYVMGVGAVAMSDAIHENINSLRKLYPIMGKSFDDVYRHMSEEDFSDIFADNGTATFRIMASLANFEEHGVLDPQGEYRTMRIPVDTSIEVEGYVFSFTHPLVITRYKNEAVEVYFDPSIGSVEEPLRSVVVPNRILRDTEEHDWIVFEVVLKQLTKTAFPVKVTYSAPFKKEIGFEDRFKRIELYHKFNGVWMPIRVTHNEFVLDSAVITAKIVVHSDKNRLTIDIHNKYIDELKIGNEILVIVYTTKGQISRDFRRVDPANFNLRLRDIATDDTLQDEENAFKHSVTIVSAVSEALGGRDALTLLELKTRMANNNTGVNILPITSNDLNSEVTKAGYYLEKLRDTLSDRVYLVSNKTVSPERDLSFSTQLEIGVNKLKVSREELENNTSVRKNGNRLTITEKTLFRNDELVIRLEDNSTRAILDDPLLSPVGLRDKLREKELLYTPFHYVLDYTTNSTDVKAYYLEEPSVKDINFADKNTTVKQRLSTAYTTLTKEENGYNLTVGVDLSEDLVGVNPSEIKVFISFKALDEDTPDVMELIYVSTDQLGNFVFKGLLRTNLDIDKRDAMILTDFPIRPTSLDKRAVPLNFKMNVAFAMVNSPSVNYTTDDIMSYIPDVNLYGIAREVYNVELGKAMTHLFTRTNTLPSVVEYMKYDADIPSHYKKDIYKRDLNGDIVDLSGSCTSGPTLEHAKGDIVKDKNSNIVLLHKEGDIKLDVTGKPIILNANQTVSIIDIIVFSHILPYISNESSKKYFSRVFEHIVEESTVRIKEVQAFALEFTDIFYRPENSNDLIEIAYGNRSTRFIKSLRRPTIVLTVTPSVINDEEVKDLLRTQTSVILNELFSLKEFSTVEVLDFFKKRYLDEVVDVNIGSLFDDVRAFRLSSDIDSFSIGKRVSLDTSGINLILEDDVKVVFEEYSV